MAPAKWSDQIAGRGGAPEAAAGACRLLPAAVMAIILAGPGPAQARDDWFGPDKVLHFAAGLAITFMGYTVAANAWDWEHERARRFGAGAGMVAGVAKEAWDGLRGRGNPSARDMVWDLVGVGAALVIINQVRPAVRRPLEMIDARFPPVGPSWLWHSPPVPQGLKSVDSTPSSPELRYTQTGLAGD